MFRDSSSSCDPLCPRLLFFRPPVFPPPNGVRQDFHPRDFYATIRPALRPYLSALLRRLRGACVSLSLRSCSAPPLPPPLCDSSTPPRFRFPTGGSRLGPAVGPRRPPPPRASSFSTPRAPAVVRRLWRTTARARWCGRCGCWRCGAWAPRRRSGCSPRSGTISSEFVVVVRGGW